MELKDVNHMFIPKMHNKQPILANKFIRSFKYLDAKTAETNTLNAPNGVTSDAGAKAYAAKLASSPIPTRKKTLIK